MLKMVGKGGSLGKLRLGRKVSGSPKLVQSMLTRWNRLGLRVTTARETVNKAKESGKPLT